MRDRDESEHLAVCEPARPAVCVYMASRHGTHLSFTYAARRLGTSLAEAGCDLVYGGGRVGLMGEVADSVMNAGGRVTGIITEHLHDMEVAHASVSELLVVPDMQTRKKEMFERSDAFAVLPGGVGTMEELFEVWCWATLGLHPKPIAILNIDGYYDHLLAFMERSIEDGLSKASTLKMLIVGDDPHDIATRLVAAIETDSV